MVSGTHWGSRKIPPLRISGANVLANVINGNLASWGGYSDIFLLALIFMHIHIVAKSNNISFSDSIVFWRV